MEEKKEVDTRKKERELPKERYDRRLYKQAVRAAKEAKVLETKRRKKESILKKVYIFFSVVLLLIVLYLLLPYFAQKAQYTLAKQYPKYARYELVLGESISYQELKEISVTSISAYAAIAFNPINGDILYEKNINERVSVASLTKLLTAIVVIENFELDQVITVNTENIPEDMTWQLGVKEGDKISVESILKAMLISSYNDTAYIIANAYPFGGYEGFIKAMNRKASMLRMDSSNFSNPAGIDDEFNYSTVKDIGILAAVVRKYDVVMDMVNSKEDVINWSGEGGVVSKEIVTTNQLYGSNRYLNGLKTGITDMAGQCFAGYFVYPNGNELITVVLNSKDRFGETVLLEKYSRSVLK